VKIRRVKEGRDSSLWQLTFHAYYFFSPFCFWERDASLRRQTFHAYNWVLRPIRCVTHCHLVIQRGLISEIAVVLLPALRCNKKGFRCNTRGFGVYEVSHIPYVETAPSAQAKTETIPVILAQHTSTYISIRHHTSLFCEWIMRPYILPPWGLKISKNCVWLESDDVWSRTATSAADVCWRMLTNADECCRMLTYTDVCWSMRMLTYAGAADVGAQERRYRLTYADVCWSMRMLTYAGAADVGEQEHRYRLANRQLHAVQIREHFDVRDSGTFAGLLYQ